MPSEFRLKWHELLKRVFGSDFEICPWCGSGKMRFVAVINEATAIAKILAALDKPPRPPPLSPATAIDDWADW
mgnify:CR=1 FL=1